MGMYALTIGLRKYVWEVIKYTWIKYGKKENGAGAFQIFSFILATDVRRVKNSGSKGGKMFPLIIQKVDIGFKTLALLNWLQKDIWTILQFIFDNVSTHRPLLLLSSVNYLVTENYCPFH